MNKKKTRITETHVDFVGIEREISERSSPDVKSKEKRFLFFSLYLTEKGRVFILNGLERGRCCRLQQ